MPKLTMIRTLMAAPALALAVLSTPAQASSPSAWQAHDADVRQACFKATGFLKPRAEGKTVLFPDDVGYTALVVTGRYPQPHMKKRQGRMLCLYERKSGDVFVGEMRR